MKLKKKLLALFIPALAVANCVAASAEEHLLEFDEFTGADAFSTVAMGNASGGEYLALTGQAELAKSFEIEESGYYDITYVVAAKTDTSLSGSGNYSTISQKLDDGNYEELYARQQIWIKNLITVENLTESMGECWNKTKYHVPVYLEAGEHSISVKASGGKANLDYVKIASADLIKVNEENSYVECERFFGDAMANADENASAGKAVHLEFATASGISLLEKEMVIYVEEAGEYGLEIGATNQTTSVYMSPMELYINDGEAISIAAGTCKIAEYDKPPFSGVWQSKRFIYDGKVTLNEGVNILKIVVKERKDGGVYGKLDYVRLSMPKSLEGLAIEMDKNVVAKDGKITFKMKNGLGQAIVLEDLTDYSINVTTPGRAKAGNGFSLIGSNAGYTEFKVSATNDLGTAEAKGSFYVSGDDGIYVTNPTVSGNTVSFDLNASTDFGGGGKALIAAYKKDGEVLTSVTETAIVDLTAVSAGEDETIECEMSDLSGVDFIRIFLVKSRVQTRTTYGKTEISLK